MEGKNTLALSITAVYVTLCDIYKCHSQIQTFHSTYDIEHLSTHTLLHVWVTSKVQQAFLRDLFYSTFALSWSLEKLE